MEKFLMSLIKLQIILFFYVCLSPVHSLAIGKNSSDYASLVSFKHQLLKQHNSALSAISMSSWNDTNKHFCSWKGVSCGRKHPYRVTALDLSSSGLVGYLPSCIANLTFLKWLDLSNNSLYGEIPRNLLHLHRLQHLNLSFNSFHGDIPTDLLANTSMFKVLSLGNNQLTGKIPLVINSMLPLNFLELDENHIIGTIPPSLSNLSFLESFYVLDNHLEGAIPQEIGGLGRLKYFNVAGNNLAGNIPSSFYNLSSLLKISLANNHLSGHILANIAQAFSNLEIFYIGENHFIGSLDQVLQNVTSIKYLDTSKNNFTGVVPPDLGEMHNLIRLNIEENELEANDAQDWRFLDSLTNCTSLELLSVNANNLGGILPKSIGNLSIELQIINLGLNHFSGIIPFELDRYTKLIFLNLGGNHLEGFIPKNIGKLGTLQFLSLSDNSLTGIIPYSLGNLTRLNQLMLGFNQLIGSIPSSLKNLQILSKLELGHNNLTGLIPRELFLIPSFSNFLDLSYNSFIGSLPLEVGHLVNLMSLYFSHNNLTGEIPKSLGSCQLLLELYMDYNFFHGSIPDSLGNVKSLKILDLSHNNLSGTIPLTLQNLTLLEHLNLSFNNLEGEVPYDGVFANYSEISLIGNKKLCGGNQKLHLPKCVAKSLSTKKRSHHLIKIFVPIFSMIFVLFLLACYILVHKKQKQSDQKRNSSDLSLNTPFPRISYEKLAKATDDFSTSFLVGYGRYGSVYRGTIIDYQATVAIKVFNLEVHGAFKSFTSECDALRNIRHRNLVRVLTSCSSIDFTGRDFKALIFEYMPKGNLEMWLHQENDIGEEVFLNLKQRLNIVIDVAVALDYLHHSCQPMIIHCDMKPSNILLNHDMIAHIGDFGLARILFESISMPIQDSDSKSIIKGTIGYVAPEYGVGARPSSSADVYSFGIILLEILTGKRPIDDMFKDGLNLHNLVSMSFPHEIANIVDPKMFAEENRDAITNSRERAREAIYQSINNCLVSIAEVGLSCSSSSPDYRPDMKEVVTKLHEVRVTYLQSVSDNT